MPTRTIDYALRVKIEDQEAKKELAQFAKQFGEVEEGAKQITFKADPKIAGIDTVMKELEKFAEKFNIRLKVDTSEVDAAKAKLEESQKFFDDLGDLYSKKNKSLVKLFDTEDQKRIGSSIKAIRNDLGKVNEQFKEQKKTAEEVTKILEEQGAKTTQSNIDKAQKELDYIELREKALERIKELEKNTKTEDGKKVKGYEKDGAALKEYIQLLELVNKIENRMGSGLTAGSSKESAVLSLFTKFKATDFKTKAENIAAAVSKVQEAEKQAAKAYKAAGGDIVGSYKNDDMTSELARALRQFYADLDKAAIAEKQMGEAGKEAGETAAEGMGEAADAAGNAGAKIDEATEKARALNEEYKKLTAKGKLESIADLKPSTGKGISTVQQDIEKFANNIGERVDLFEQSDVVEAKEIEEAISQTDKLLETINKSYQNIRQSSAADTKQALEYYEVVKKIKEAIEGNKEAGVSGYRDRLQTQLNLAASTKGGGTGEGGTGTGTGEGGTGEHNGPLYSEEDVQKSEENINKTKEHILTAIDEIREQLKLEVNFDEEKLQGFLGSLRSIIESLDTIKDKFVEVNTANASTNNVQETQQEAQATEQVTQATKEEIKAVEDEIATLKKKSDELRNLIEVEVQYENKTQAAKALKYHYDQLQKGRTNENIVRYMKAHNGAEDADVNATKLEDTYWDQTAFNEYKQALEALKAEYTEIESKIATLQARLEEMNGTLSSSAPQQEATQLDNVEQQASEAADAVNKLKDAEASLNAGVAGNIPVDVHLDEDTKYVLSTELNTVVDQLKGLHKIMLDVGLSGESITELGRLIDNLIGVMQGKGPIYFDAKIRDESRVKIKQEIQDIATSIKGPDGKGLPIDIELSSNSVKNMEERVKNIAQQVNDTVAKSKTIDSKNVTIPVKLASISDLVSQAVREYNSTDNHPSTHTIRLTASLTSTNLMDSIRTAVSAVNEQLKNGKGPSIKVPAKAETNKTLKDAGLKSTEELLQKIKDDYSNLEVNIKLAKGNDIDKINEVFTKIKDALNQVNKSGGIKIIYGTNGAGKNGSNIVEHSADEEKALKSLNNELDSLIKKYRDFQNTDSLFADKNTRDTQEAQNLKTAVEDLYHSLTTLDVNETSDVNTFTGILDQFAQRLSELKIEAKDTYSSITSEAKKAANATETSVSALEKVLAEAESYMSKGTGLSTTSLINNPERQSGYDLNQVEQLKIAYNDLRTAINNLHDAYGKNEDVDDAVKGYKEAKTSLEAFYNTLEKVVKKGVVGDIWNANSLDEAKAKIAEFNQNLGNFGTQNLKAEKGVYKLNYAIQEQGGMVKTLTYTYNTATNELKLYGEQEKKVVSIGERFSAMLKERGMSLVAYLGTFASFYRLVGVLKDGINVIHEVDTAFTELRKVAQETDDQLKSFANTAAFDIAEAVGSTGKDIINLAADFARLGYSLQEAQRLAKDTAIYMNVGDIEDSQEAMESLVSTMKGFGLQAEDSTKIIDEFNEVGNRFAISSAGIGEALERSSASLAQANNSLEEAISLATVSNQIIQNPEQVGNTLKVVALRIRGKVFVPICNENYSPCCA